MTNLDFIEEKIENIKFSLERLKPHEPNDPYIKHLLEENNKDLNILEQIKTILEVWEMLLKDKNKKGGKNMENFNQKDDYTKATNSLENGEKCEKIRYEDVKSAVIPYEMYHKLQRENEVLKDAIVKLTLKVMGLERQLHPDVW